MKYSSYYNMFKGKSKRLINFGVAIILIMVIVLQGFGFLEHKSISSEKSGQVLYNLEKIEGKYFLQNVQVGQEDGVTFDTLSVMNIGDLKFNYILPEDWEIESHYGEDTDAEVINFSFPANDGDEIVKFLSDEDTYFNSLKDDLVVN
ncbi:MAG: hypothetical protein LBM02_06990, partial [Lachnospiraceae bacterium]|nr:hypothetical protein [Lachnospiraceae bacterium]